MLSEPASVLTCLEAALARQFAPQLKVRESDHRDHEDKPLIASSAAWALQLRAGADEERARASCALIVMLLDDLQQRLRKALRPNAKPSDFRFGPAIGRTTLSLALFAAANSVRHAEEWEKLPWTLSGYDFSKNRTAGVSIEILSDAFGEQRRFGGRHRRHSNRSRQR